MNVPLKPGLEAIVEAGAYTLEDMPAARNTIIPVIMCGGSGTRLWPVSRNTMPKQFVPLLHDLSSFQATMQRLTASTFAKPIVVTSHEVRFIVAEQLQAIGVAADIVLEPQRRDSAAAVAAAALLVAERDPAAIALVAAADHVIEDSGAFLAACSQAAIGARQGLIMTLGIEPTRAATEYGYIEPGEPIPGSDAAVAAKHVARFVEKPNAAAAATYVADGYLWNSGNFLFRADVMIGELATHAPAVLSAVQEARRTALTDLDFLRLGSEAFARAPKVSIDYAVMEHTDKAAVLPVTFAWSDVGNWSAVWEEMPHDAAGNALRGSAEVVDVRDSLVYSDGILTTVVGLQDVVVATTADAVLVTSRSQSGRVKDLVARLQARQRPEVDEHLQMYRPWGWYQRVDVGPRFQVKRIMVKPGQRLSLQKHHHRAEHWVVVRGTAEVTVDGVVATRHENEAAYIPIGAIHRLANPGKIPLELIEVQVGSYTGEDDIIRLDDAYGR